MKQNIFKQLIENKNVNLYTKLYLILYQLDYYKKYYIPNQLIMNRLKVNQPNATRLIQQMKKDKIIRIYYKGSRRYFEFIDKELEELRRKDDFRYIPTDEEQKKINDILTYNWLEDN